MPGQSSLLFIFTAGTPAVLTNRASQRKVSFLLDIPSPAFIMHIELNLGCATFLRAFRVLLAAFLGFGVDYRIVSHN